MQCTAYADYILITTRTTQVMADTFIKLKHESLKYGLIVNVHKKIPEMLQETRPAKTHKY